MSTDIYTHNHTFDAWYLPVLNTYLLSPHHRFLFINKPDKIRTYILEIDWSTAGKFNRFQSTIVQLYGGMHMHMVEITLILHGYQSKFPLTRVTYMSNVVFFHIYVQHLSNRNHLEGHNVNIYWYILKKLRKHQSKNLMIGWSFFWKNCTDPKPRACLSWGKFYKT